MARKYRYCIHCRRVLIESEIQRGEFVNTDFGILCPQCAEKLRAEQPPPPPPPPEKETEPATPEEPPAQVPPQAEPKPEPPKPSRPSRARRASSTVAAPKAEPAPIVEPPPKVEPAPPPAVNTPEPPGTSPELRRISEQLDQLLRAMLFEKSSIWNIMGAVAQCIAAGVFIIALLNWLDGPQLLLQTALLLQVAALTFFVKGK